MSCRDRGVGTVSQRYVGVQSLNYVRLAAAGLAGLSCNSMECKASNKTTKALPAALKTGR